MIVVFWLAASELLRDTRGNWLAAADGGTLLLHDDDLLIIYSELPSFPNVSKTHLKQLHPVVLGCLKTVVL